MSSGMPTALPLYRVTRNLARAMHVIAATCLAAAGVIVLGFQVAAPQLTLWPALVSLVPISFALVLVDRYRRLVFSVVYLAVGGASVYGFALTVGAALEPVILTRCLTVELPALAMLLVGGRRAGATSTLVWSVCGFLVAQAASSVALAQAGVPWRFDWVSSGGLGLIVLVLFFGRVNRSRAALTRPRFSRAARDELVAALRYRIELRAAAMLHDTVLSHLAAVAATTSSALDPGLVDRMRHDLAALTAGDWLQAPPVTAHQRDDWKATPLYAAIRDARSSGLEVGVTGDVSAALTLDDDRAVQLALAITQCLANVLRHAGTRDAEVALYGSDDEVLAMVVDTGRGFDVDADRPDRLGLRHSVSGRMEDIGGSVQVWSTPGKGTSVVLRVPVRAGTGTSVAQPMGLAG